MRIRPGLVALTLLLTLVMSTATFAQQKTDQKDPPLPGPLLKQRNAGAQIYYLGKHDSLDGWVMVRAGKPEFYYVTPEGSLVLGILFDRDGKMLTPNQMIALQQSRKDALLDLVQPDATGPMPEPGAAPAAPVAQNPAAPVAAAPAAPGSTPNPATPPVAANIVQGGIDPTEPIMSPSASSNASPSERLMAAMTDAPALIWGNAGAPAFYAFIDPNCTHCQRFLREVTPFVQAGRVSVHIILVGFTPDSMRQAAFAMASADGLQRLLRYANEDFEALPDSNPDIDTSVPKLNTQLMDAWSLTATPIILYRAPEDQKIRLIRGRPRDVPAVVNHLSPGLN